MTNVRARMNHLIKKLSEAAEGYYSGHFESDLSDYQYDALLSELFDLEEKSGIRLKNSPVGKIGNAYSNNEPEKFIHQFPMLSLRSTKSKEAVINFLGDHIVDGKAVKGILSWKLDGVSLILYYDRGVLLRAVTRGDGRIGKDVTKIVEGIPTIPFTIQSKKPIVIRGEVVISYKSFDEIGGAYKNPRNMAAGLLNRNDINNDICRLHFFAHTAVVLSAGLDTVEQQYVTMENLGFDLVPYEVLCHFDLEDRIEVMSNRSDEYPYPVDGLVLRIDNLEYGRTLGHNLHHPHDTLAYKWEDEVIQTKVFGVKWSVADSGLITPIVQFSPVELEGTTVKQANLHSLRIFEELKLREGDMISVYKANKIVPEVLEVYCRDETGWELSVPDKCPRCGGSVKTVRTDKTAKLYCNHDFQICEEGRIEYE